MPERPHAAEGQPGGAFGHLEGEVGPVEAGGAERGVEDGGRQGVADRRADDAGGAGVPGDHAATRSPARRRGSAALAARNSLLLSVKKWFPSASSST